jgi:3-methyladenine DNA glycosylase/8-oxoguanine DNA glycosylase
VDFRPTQLWHDLKSPVAKRQKTKRVTHSRKMPKSEQLEKFGKKWSPHRTTAALYMYRAADFLKDGEW